MYLRLRKLTLACRKAVEEQEFLDINYFYGEIGSGKSTIARLVDYALGSKHLIMTPALQSEFVSVELTLDVSGVGTSIYRERESQQAVVGWGKDDDQQQVSIPVRKPAGVVLPDTTVEVLSDLIFHIAGISQPRVRRSQHREESDLERLSLRDLWWYCYLDQDEIDSNFFYLDPDAETFRRLKSRNVLRLILGVHQEKVAELEMELETQRLDRLRAEDAAKVLESTLNEAGFATEIEIEGLIKELEERIEALANERDGIRSQHEIERTHESDRLRSQARELADEIESVAKAQEELRLASDNDRAHLAEIRSLTTKVSRVVRARSVLNAVEFERCPRCTQLLPGRDSASCPVCAQPEPDFEQSEDAIVATRADLVARERELEEIIRMQEDQHGLVSRRRQALEGKKSRVDALLADAMTAYDSSYLARALGVERELAEAKEELRYLHRIRVLPERVEELKAKAAALEGRERELRESLNQARELAQRDTRNFTRLKTLFLDCLVRTQIPGFEEADSISMEAPWFLPEAQREDSGQLVVTSFSTLGSGGKKTLFKACFALAVHRLAREVGAILPSVLIIDSPMKNISERENREQFEGFHRLVYELAAGELKDTQVVIIDKELYPPPIGLEPRTLVRHMTLDDEENPPLISYYRG